MEMAAAAAVPGVEAILWVHIRQACRGSREAGECPSADSGRFRHGRMKIYGHTSMKPV